MSVYFAHSVYPYASPHSSPPPAPPSNGNTQTPQPPQSLPLPSTFNAKTTQPKTIKIAIIGAGIAGLALTIGLLKHTHLQILIYEAASSFEELGAGIGFGRNATEAMRLIDPKIVEGFQKVATGNGRWFDYYWGGKGKVGIVGKEEMIDEDTGFKILSAERKERELRGQVDTVHRKDFLDVLIKLIPPGTAVFCKRLASIDRSSSPAMLTFQDGTSATADAVIGCDGIRSVVRQNILGPDSKATYSGKYCYRALVPMSQAKLVLGGRADSRQIFLAKGGHVLTFPVERGRTLNVVAIHSSPDGKWGHGSWLRRVGREEMMEDFERHSEVVKKILGMIQGDHQQWAIFEHASSSTYISGPLALLGDSAHASSPHQGAGAGMAIEDAFLLHNLVGSCRDAKELEHAFVAYDSLRRPRTQKVVATSKRRGRLLSLESESLWKGDGKEERLDLGMIEEMMRGEMDWIWDVDLKGELEKARVVFGERRSTELGV